MVTLHEVITFLVSMQISISSLQTHNVNRCGRSRHLARKLSLRRKRSSKPPRFGGMKTYNWEGVNPDGYFLDKLEPIPSALPSFQKLFQVSATALSIP